MLEAYARRMLAEMAADSSAHADAAAVLADAETFAASENSGDFASQVNDIRVCMRSQIMCAQS